MTIGSLRNVPDIMDHINKWAIAKIIFLILVYMNGIDQYVSPANITVEDMVVLNEHSMD